MNALERFGFQPRFSNSPNSFMLTWAGLCSRTEIPRSTRNLDISPSLSETTLTPYLEPVVKRHVTPLQIQRSRSLRGGRTQTDDVAASAQPRSRHLAVQRNCFARAERGVASDAQSCAHHGQPPLDLLRGEAVGDGHRRAPLRRRGRSSKEVDIGSELVELPCGSWWRPTALWGRHLAYIHTSGFDRVRDLDNGQGFRLGLQCVKRTARTIPRYTATASAVSGSTRPTASPGRTPAAFNAHATLAACARRRRRGHTMSSRGRASSAVTIAGASGSPCSAAAATLKRAPALVFCGVWEG